MTIAVSPLETPRFALLRAQTNARLCELSRSRWARKAKIARATLNRILDADDPDPRSSTFLAILSGAGLVVHIDDRAVLTSDDATIVLEQVRMARGCSIESLAVDLRVAKARVRRILGGQGHPRICEVVSIADALGCKMVMVASAATQPHVTLEDYLAVYVEEFRHLRASVPRLKASLKQELDAHATTRDRLAGLEAELRPHQEYARVLAALGNETLEKVLADREALAEQVVQLGSERSDLAVQVAALETERSELGEQVAALESSSFLAARAAAFESRRSALAESVAVVSSSALAAQVAALESERDALSDRVATLKTERDDEAAVTPDPLSFLADTSHKRWTRAQWIKITTMSATVADMCRVTRLHERTVRSYLQAFKISDRWHSRWSIGSLCFLDRDFGTWTAQEWKRLVDRTSSAVQVANVVRLPLEVVATSLAKLEVDTRGWSNSLDC